MSRKNQKTQTMSARGKQAIPKAAAPRRQNKVLLPILPFFFLVVWLWGAFYYDSVLHVTREYSFWAVDIRLMQFVLSQSFGPLRYVGRMLLQICQYPWLGALLLAMMLTLGSWLFGYCLRLSPKWRLLQYVPAFLYLGVVTYLGLDVFFEAETGYLFGIPFVVLLVLSIWGVMIRSFSRKPVPSLFRIPKDETPRQNHCQLILLVLAFSVVIGFGEWKRPYVRVVCQEMAMQYEQDWTGIQRVARANAIQSNRPMAAYYAMALLHTGQIAERMYDIRLDYDSLYLHGMDKMHNNGNGLYIPEGNYHAGFVEPCMHACMEQMVMSGPTLRLLKLQIKCALMRGEWMLCRKYFRILHEVPFEQAFICKYEPMVEHPDLVNADPEMARLRLTEPIHDCFESQFQQPFFMGYNLNLVEARSAEALYNCLCVCLYTKLMPPFLARTQLLKGSTPPETIADGLLLAEMKHPGASQGYGNLDMRATRLQSFVQAVQPYMKDRPAHAYELFSKYKGYYPYYYFFGNLKATKKGYTGEKASNSGVN